MYGHGAAPPTRSAAAVITLRVLIAAAGILSCGVLACVPLFRIAFLRGRAWDWVGAWLSMPLSITCFVVVGALPQEDVRTDIALAVVLLLGMASSTYFLVVDVRSQDRPRQFGGYAGPHAPTVHGPYGYPQSGSPYAPTPVPGPPQAHPHATPAPRPPLPQTPLPQPPAPQPAPPQRPAPARIDQVRAELDELSDYLRRGEGGQDGPHGGGEGGR
ncbi:hypothetical protein ACIF8T_13885 [Streptomyces sp. NPDC085946]|uniref:hypothetical protein n=1 Tax=Streptomyces sp. NPDC085946 TaxID=3365744 RepID=UPI0037D26253